MNKMNKTWDGWSSPGDQMREPSKWKQKRAWRLKKCKLTGDLILPGTKAWCKTYYHYYNGKSAFSHWVTTAAYTFELLKNTGKLDRDL